MIENKDFICVSNTTWYGEYTKSTVQLMSRLARHNRVVFIEYPFTVKDALLALFARRNDVPVKRMFGIKKRLTTIQSDVGTAVFQLVMPPVLPIYFLKNEKLFQFALSINTKIYKRCLKRTMKAIGIQSPVIVNAYNPFYGLPLVGKLNQCLDVYYCYDGYDTGRYGDRVYAVDHRFSAAADAVITTSDYLRLDKLKFNKASYVVKNGVDYDMFAAHAKASVKKEGSKIVGYIGSLDHRFDIDIVEYAVDQLPGFEFHFTGSLRNDAIKQRLGKFPNVRFFPAIKPEEVPALLASYDVGIIPYTITGYNKNIYPLKINEYLAVGVPVVMTAFAELKDFNEIVSVATDKSRFVEAIKNETSNDSEDEINARCEFARSNSWDERTEEFSVILKNTLINK